MADDTACRILLVASPAAQADVFIERVKALDADAAPDAGYAPVLDDGADAELALTPWTIRNRYYAADVHFAARARGWRVRDAFGVPALVVVWAHGAPIREWLEQIHGDLAGSRLDPEVCLAVQLPAAEDASPPAADVDDDALDELLASLGFEYVDARTVRPPVLDVDAEPDVPGLPRVRDALSTIMWPSMVQAPRTAARGSRAANLLGRGPDESGLAGLLAGGGSGGFAEFERWLEEDDGHDDDHGGDHDDGSEREDGDDNDDDGPTRVHGFDDDFAAFVSAPPHAAAASDAASAAPLATGMDPLALDTSFDATYDFSAGRSPLVGRAAATTDSEDPALPSRAEVRATSQRLFAGARDEGAFDLGNVLASLEGMKAEIAGIPDEDARRVAAARVALGLVHGLGLDDDDE